MNEAYDSIESTTCSSQVAEIFSGASPSSEAILSVLTVIFAVPVLRALSLIIFMFGVFPSVILITSAMSLPFTSFETSHTRGSSAVLGDSIAIISYSFLPSISIIYLLLLNERTVAGEDTFTTNEALAGSALLVIAVTVAKPLLFCAVSIPVFSSTATTDVSLDCHIISSVEEFPSFSTSYLRMLLASYLSPVFRLIELTVLPFSSLKRRFFIAFDSSIVIVVEQLYVL